MLQNLRKEAAYADALGHLRDVNRNGPGVTRSRKRDHRITSFTRLGAGMVSGYQHVAGKDTVPLVGVLP